MRACARTLVPDPGLDACLAGEAVATHRLRRWPAKKILEERSDWMYPPGPKCSRAKHHITL